MTQGLTAAGTASPAPPRAPEITSTDAHPHTAVLETSQILPGTPEEVFPFFADAFNLEMITPPWLRFRVLTPAPITMEVGTLIDYRLRWRVVPVRWRTRIAMWEPPFRFADEQLRGPYRRWFHVHTFEAHERGTRMTDRVEYRAPLASISHPMVVRRDVERIFAWRRLRLTELLGPA